MRSIVGHSSSLMRVKPSRVRCWLTWKIFCSASSSSSAAVRAALERLGDDRRRDLDQAAEQRLLADDLARGTRRSPPSAPRRRGSRCSPCRRCASSSPRRCSSSASVSGSTTLAALGDRQHRAEDPAVPLAVEHRVVDVLDGAHDRVLVDAASPPSTACSASSEYGGRRSRYGSRPVAARSRIRRASWTSSQVGRFQAGFRSSAAGW